MEEFLSRNFDSSKEMFFLIMTFSVSVDWLLER